MQGFIEWSPLTFPGDQPNIDSLYNLWTFQLNRKFWPQEKLEINDCFYRNRLLYDYIAVLDIDDVIMPMGLNNWHELLDLIEVTLVQHLDRDTALKEHTFLRPLSIHR